MLSEQFDAELSEATTIALKDPKTIAGLSNFRKAFSITHKANQKILAAAFSIDKEENVLVGSRGTISSTFTYCQQVINKLFKLLMDFLGFTTNTMSKIVQKEERMQQLKQRIQRSRDCNGQGEKCRAGGEVS